MTTDTRIERALPLILADLGTGPALDYTDTILRRTAVMSQRPRWASIEWWLPMERTRHWVGAAPRVPLRAMAVLALVLIALAAGAVLIANAPPRQLPAPFGPAGNGLVAFAWTGRDIHLGDPGTGESRAITSGPETDHSPQFSPNGAKLLFLRTPDGPSTTANLMIANADGSDLRQLTPEPLQKVGGVNWSGDSGSIVVSSAIAGVPSVTVFDVETGKARTLDVGTAAASAAFRPPAGAELLFLGGDLGHQGVYLVRRDGSELRSLELKGCESPAWSPDGTQIAYSKFDMASGRVFLHIVGADGRGDLRLETPTGVIREDEPVWSPDGRFLLVLRSYWDGSGFVPPGTTADELRVAVIAVDGSVADREFEADDLDLGATRGWSPDGTKIVSAEPAGYAVRDLATGVESTFDGWFSASWQRVAAAP